MPGQVDLVDGPAGPIFDVEVAGPVSALDLSPRGRRGRTGDLGPTGPQGPPARFTRDWRRDGLAGLVSTVPTYLSRATAALSEPHHTPSIVDGKLRVSSGVANTNPDVREAWLLSDEDYTDVEVFAEIGLPTTPILTSAPPQLGVVLRQRDNGDGTSSRVNVDNNSYPAYGPINMGVWSSTRGEDGSIVMTVRTQLQTLQIPTRTAAILSHERFQFAGQWIDRHRVIDARGIASGDVIDIASTAAGFAQTGATVLGVDVDAVIVASPAGQTSAVPLTVDGGSMSIPTGTYDNTTGLNARAFFPARIRARIVGTTLGVKWWLKGQREPDQFTTLDLSSETYLAASGKVGLLVNHINGGGYVEFGGVEVTPLATL